MKLTIIDFEGVTPLGSGLLLEPLFINIPYFQDG